MYTTDKILRELLVNDFYSSNLLFRTPVFSKPVDVDDMHLVFNL